MKRATRRVARNDGAWMIKLVTRRGLEPPNLEIKSTNGDFTEKHQDDLRRTKDKEKDDSDESG